MGNCLFHLREVVPKDFYFAQIVRQQERSLLDIMERLVLNPEVFDEATIAETRAVMNWAVENLIDKNILTVENWLETAYHLCKQRWDSSVDWLETQPMSKIHTMIEIVQNHAKETEKAHKKAAKKKK